MIKNQRRSLLKDLLSHLGYTVGGMISSTSSYLGSIPVERRYPLSKDLLQRMLDLGLEVERESSVALDLIRFIKQQIDEE
ncbi:hypothetical protein Tco_1235616 [Tanacetum coccineum]